LALPCILTTVISIIACILTIPEISSSNRFLAKNSMLLQHSKNTVVLYLMLLQSLQDICCFPLLSLTHTLYAYCLGFVRGFCICIIWEIASVCVFVVVATQNKQATRLPAAGENLQEFLEYAAFLKNVVSSKRKQSIFRFRSRADGSILSFLSFLSRRCHACAK